ncbi:glycosyltransferase family 39 protein [Companilactobacillus versmoldensis]|uniref:Integral membrane protein n=1 Tax=Companilactobacillus versmoldensis DSM 14857 = KCTC 3814 TaxID=1423815 RepID=A0A0R1SEZ0_9LACO|nr:glycosyltransferase family 39 protein [Companilactobacillus versmoldensis]KRL68134.1 integral membrane protein [Companilactobacillus versmoldensis DSM 14857 = KCTC 3814]
MNRPEVHYPKNLNSRYKRHCFKNKIIRNRLISPLGIPQKRAPLGPHSLQRPDKLEALSQTNQHQKSSSIVESLKLLGQAVSIIVAIILLAFMSIVTWKANAHLISNMWETVAMVLICLTIFLGIYLISNVLKKSAFIVFVSVLVLIAIAKIVLISVYTIHPTSDFFSYHYLAFARVSGIAWTKKLVGINLFYPHVLNVALIDSIPYSIIGTNYLTAQVFNIILTLFDAILIYKLNKRIFNQSAGVFAAITFSLIPAYFLYTVLNGAEPLFLTAVLGMMLAFDTFVHLDDDSSIAQWTSSYRNLFLLSMIAYLIRPTVGIWLIAALLYL